MILLKRLCSIYFLAVCLLLIQCSNKHPTPPLADDFPVLKGPYLGQKVPGIIPEMFAPGIISTGLMEGTINFTPDGKELYYHFAYTVKKDAKLLIVYSKVENGIWTKPNFVDFIDRKYLQAYPFISYDGNELYYTSNQPTNDPNLKNEYNIWMSRRKNNQWDRPVPLPRPINGRGDVSGPSVSKSGVIYYTLITKEEQAIYRSAFKNGKYSEPERLPDTVNSTKSQFDGVISPDESFMILPVYNRKDSFGSTDLYVTFKDKNNIWTPVVNLGDKVNTKFTESASRISADGKYIFFTGHIISHNWGNPSPTYTDVINYYTKPGYGSPDIYWVDAKFLDRFKPDSLK